MFAYTIPVQCNVQTLNVRKDSARGFGLVIIKNTKEKHNYTTLAIIIYGATYTKHNQSNYTKTLQ